MDLALRYTAFTVYTVYTLCTIQTALHCSFKLLYIAYYKNCFNNSIYPDIYRVSQKNALSESSSCKESQNARAGLFSRF